MKNISNDNHFVQTKIRITRFNRNAFLIASCNMLLFSSSDLVRVKQKPTIVNIVFFSLEILLDAWSLAKTHEYHKTLVLLKEGKTNF